MEPFFPFIHQIPEKNITEPLPLYIELIEPILENEIVSEEQEEPRVLIIDLW